jgi:DNA-binding transcriptional MerR regulator
MQKLYYSISEVSMLVDEEQHILRYWEKEFDQLKPKKNRAGNRTYSEKDLATIKLIKKLLRIDKLSLKGAKENIENTQLSNNDIETIVSQQRINFSGSSSGFNSDRKEEHTKNVTKINTVELKEIRGLLKDILDFLR